MMRCIYCPLGSDEDVCPESEGFLQGYTQYSIFDEKGEENQ